jgi:hypothetical protein
MAKSQLRHHDSTNRIPRQESGNRDARRSLEEESNVRGANEDPSVFLMCAYFLGLASAAVFVVGGHFPWFTLAPAMVLLMFAHVRRIEAKFQREAANRPLKTHP